MSFNDILFYIIIPIVSAIIGGGVTFIGVLITIGNEKKNRKNDMIIANKPILYHIIYRV